MQETGAHPVTGAPQLVPWELATGAARVEVWDADRFDRDDFLGRADVRLRDLVPGGDLREGYAGVDVWLPLQLVAAAPGREADPIDARTPAPPWLPHPALRAPTERTRLIKT